MLGCFGSLAVGFGSSAYWGYVCSESDELKLAAGLVPGRLSMAVKYGCHDGMV